MTLHPLAKKLHLKAGHRVLVLNAPPGYAAAFTPLPDGVKVSYQPDGSYDWVQLFVKDKGELEHWLATAKDAATYDALLWICYPKGGRGTDINRDSLARLVEGHGLKAVTQVAIDERWSALRFRPPERVGR